MKDMSRRSAGTAIPIAAFYGAALAVLAWRLAAWAPWVRRPDPDRLDWIVPSLLALVGVSFLVCGLVVLRRWPGRASRLFAGFCICYGLHWGGPLEPSAASLRTALLLFYLLISGVLSATLLLHFVLAFPRPWRAGQSPVVLRVLYAPAVVAALFCVIAVVSPSGSGPRTFAQQGFLLVHTIVSNLYSFAALLLYVVLLFGRSMNSSQKKYVALMVLGMLTAWLPYIIASGLNVENTDPWNLTVVALPLSFVLAFGGLFLRAGNPTPD